MHHEQAIPDVLLCHITTIGRITGHPRVTEIWFAANGSTLYLLAGGGRDSDWVRNLLKTPGVVVTIAGQRWAGTGRVVREPVEEALARRLLFEKYQPGYSGDLTNWSQTALPIAIDIASG